jgi:protein involved in polysaccharide export with SLBB domain
MPVALRITSLAAVIVGLVCGCASEATKPRTSGASPAVARPPVVRYSDVRPDDLIPPAPGDYYVRPGDVVEVSVSDLVGPGVETVKVCRVSDSGTISLPLVGAIHVAGMTEAEVNQVVREALSHLCM